MDENSVIDLLQTWCFPLWRGKITSDHFQCLCDAKSTVQVEVPA